MKLVIVLMLTALLLACYAGSGCEIIESVISKTIDPSESKSHFSEDLQQFIPGSMTANALRKLKQCFLNQRNETLNNVYELMDAIYNSEQCAAY